MTRAAEVLIAEPLAKHWVGNAARALFESIYRRVEDGARAWILSTGRTAAGRLPDAGERYRTRFGGLGGDRKERSRRLG